MWQTYPKAGVFIKAEIILLVYKGCMEKAQAFTWLPVGKIAYEGN